LEDTRQAKEGKGKVDYGGWLKEFDEISAGNQNTGNKKRHKD
jgi:hypothetical protein